MGYFLVLLDVTVVNIALPSMHADLNLSGSALAWVVDAYSVPLASLLLAAGAVGDRIGHRRIVLLGFACFGLGSVACATAQGPTMLLAARTVQGLGAALCLPGTLAMLTELAPDERSRSRWVGIWAAIGGAALPAGPLLGGAMISWWGWRSIFWINVPLIVAALLVLARSAPVARAPGDRRTPVDVVGAVVLTAAVASLVIAVSEASNELRTATVSAAASVLLGVVFFFWERRASPGLLPVPPSQRRPLARAAGIAGVMNMCSQGSLFVLTQVVQTAQGHSPIVAGVIMLPAFLPLPLLGGPAGKLVSRIGAWPTAAAGLGIGAVGFVVTGLEVTGGMGPLFLVGLLLWGTGLGVLTPGIVAAAMEAVPEAPGVASGASNTARQIGGALGVAAFATMAGPVGHPMFLSAVERSMLVAGAAFAASAVLAGLRSRRG